MNYEPLTSFSTDTADRGVGREHVPLVLATRNAAIDHVRIMLTALVVFHHTAIVYGGSGGWFWREQPNGSNSLLVMFNAVNQAYFMGFFFLLAGYYTPSSYERKGAARFVVDRLVRLGIPLLVFFLALFPLTVALARTSEGHAFWSGWWAMFRSGVFGPGPLWFAEALLLFAAVYLLWRKLGLALAHPPRTRLPSFVSLAITAVLLGLASFTVRLVMPVGRELAWLQLGYFPCYIYLFAAGCAASRSRLLENISLRDARPWVIVSLCALLSLPVVLLSAHGQGAFEGGWNLYALYYALWDPLVAWGIILGLLFVTRRYWSRATPLTRWLSANAYAAYIVHPPVVVAMSLAAAHLDWPPAGKFLLVGLLASVGSFLAGAIARAIPGADRCI
jgi:glucan biosynthesis protein C